MTDKLTAEELKTYLKEMIPEHDHKCQAYTQLVALIEQSVTTNQQVEQQKERGK